MTVRRIFALLAAAVMAAVVVCNAAVSLLAVSAPAKAPAVWPGHPAADIASAMLTIAQSAKAGRSIPQNVYSTLADAAVKDPLAPEPLLVRGVRAQTSGDEQQAVRAFAAAQWRDPRSLPAAFFLADHYVRLGDADHGLAQIAVLTRLNPAGSQAAIPYIAEFAANPSTWPAVRKVFQSNPELSAPVLKALAGNIATAPAVLALAAPSKDALDSSWFAPLLNTLIEAGQAREARAIWGRATGTPAGELIHDTSFTDKRSPPPFNWSLASSGVGLAERQPGGRLHVLFYGQEDGILASQTLTLQRGSYRLAVKLIGSSTGATNLNWSLWCDKALAPLASVSLQQAATRGWQFTVPDGCTTQSLRLSGAAGEMSQQIEATIGGLAIVRIDGA